jgi:hypothetical protein
VHEGSLAQGRTLTGAEKQNLLAFIDLL